LLEWNQLHYAEDYALGHGDEPVAFVLFDDLPVTQARIKDNFQLFGPAVRTLTGKGWFDA
jgi:hypothetical protein